MSKEISWKEKFELVLKEELTIKEIMMLCSVGQPRASIIRKKAIELCMNDNIDLYSMQVPTEAVLKVINKDINYYRDKMNLEFEISRLRR
ncbi:MAG: hypothetical protein IKZ96_03270 [Bacilli bacterium]|nr:hypothetical protein [Bacilli bacterium]